MSDSAITRTPSRTLLASLLLLVSTGCSVIGARTVEEASHTVLQKDGPFELRQYDQIVIVQTTVEAPYDKVGSIAFDRLFGYISGENRERSKIAMTAPVLTEPRLESEGQKIAMTAPVLTEGDGEAWRVAFVLPSSFTPDTAPIPLDPRVELATVPAKRVAAVRFAGFLNEDRARKYEQELLAWMRSNDLAPSSATRSAGYDPPWTLPPLRRNEVLIDAEEEGASSTGR